MKKWSMVLWITLVMVLLSVGTLAWTTTLPRSELKVRDWKPYADQIQAEYFERFNRTIQEDLKVLELNNATKVGNMAIIEFKLNGTPYTMITILK